MKNQRGWMLKAFAKLRRDTENLDTKAEYIKHKAPCATKTFHSQIPISPLAGPLPMGNAGYHWGFGSFGMNPVGLPLLTLCYYRDLEGGL